MVTNVVQSQLPRHIRRLIVATEQCHYQREEYATSTERNHRYTLLKGTPGLVKYSDSGAVGLVYVVAWPRPALGGDDFKNEAGIGVATGKTTGGRGLHTVANKLAKIDRDASSMETPKLPTENWTFSE